MIVHRAAWNEGVRLAFEWGCYRRAIMKIIVVG